MQIFLTDKSYEKCAIHLDDKRLNKIIIESAQIASTSLWINDCSLAETLYSEGKIYLPSHEHHPLCKWCADHGDNFVCVVSYSYVFCEEYEYRFGKPHATKKKLHYLMTCGYPENITVFQPKIQMPNCTTNNKHIDDIYLAYQKELCYKWDNDKVIPKWTRREKPIWYK